MKKLLFGTFVIVFTLSSVLVNAQAKKGAYVGVNVGYNAAGGAANLQSLQNFTQTASSIYETENIKMSFGKGVSAGVNLGYMFNENLGFDLGINYLVGGKTNATSKQINGDYDKSTVSAKMIQIKPSVVLATKIKNVMPYAKLGLVLGSAKVTEAGENKSASTIISQKIELKNGLAIGFNAAMGVNIPMNKKLTFSAEVNTINMQYSPKKGTQTEYKVNGADKLSTLSIYQKEVKYVKKEVNNYSIPPVTTTPNELAAIALPFGSIGVNIGVKYSF